ncbi:MOK protein kinase [Phyllostomus discolor]|uniref:MOK protein kinase n=1 Tax=Phyllostomus discolor TaxID=89673 RepID=A0A834BM90_9CHIR|nr:MOK protein kinase [Phyllostomus discolor]
MKNYRVIGKIGEGTFSEVVKMQSLRDGHYYAGKQMKQPFESLEQANSLREVRALRHLNPHPHILTLHEVVFDRKSGSLALICELMDMNIYELIRGRRRPLSERKVARYAYQLCRALDHVHRSGIFHRDVKPENILIKRLRRAAAHGVHLHPLVPRPRVPAHGRLLQLQDGPVERRLRPLRDGQPAAPLPGGQRAGPDLEDPRRHGHPTRQDPHQVQAGSGIPLPTASLSPQGLCLLRAMVAYDPDERISAHQALQHPYFREQRAAEKQAPGSHRDAGFPECPGAEDPPCGNWQASKESRKQQWPLKQQEDWPGRPAPAARTELPRLKLSGVISLPSPRLALPPVFGVRGRGAAPRLRPLECGDANQKTDPQPAAQKEVKADQKRRRLPAAHRRGGGC